MLEFISQEYFYSEMFQGICEIMIIIMIIIELWGLTRRAFKSQNLGLVTLLLYATHHAPGCKRFGCPFGCSSCINGRKHAIFYPH